VETGYTDGVTRWTTLIQRVALAVNIGVSLVAVTSCGDKPPTSPSVTSGPPPSPVAQLPSVLGAWVGTYHVSCPGSPNCGTVTGGPPTLPQPFSLVVNQTGDALSGQINLSGWINLVADVTGTIAQDGTISLQGGSSWPADDFCTPAGGWHIASWNTRYDSRTDMITGGFSFVTQKHLSSCYYDQNLTVNGSSASFVRGRAPNAPFEGHWQGTYIVRTCTPVGWPFCYPQQAGEFPFDLTLTQHGTTVSGTLGFFSGTPPDGIPVTGTVGADGVTLTLQVSWSRPVSGATEVLRLTAWTTARDAVGRMQGSFSFIDEVHWNAGINQGTVYSSTYDVALRSVILVPSP